MPKPIDLDAVERDVSECFNPTDIYRANQWVANHALRLIAALRQSRLDLEAMRGLLKGKCTCGADRTGPSAEAHDKRCAAARLIRDWTEAEIDAAIQSTRPAAADQGRAGT
jgi:hypothetical protein